MIFKIIAVLALVISLWSAFGVIYNTITLNTINKIVEILNKRLAKFEVRNNVLWEQMWKNFEEAIKNEKEET